MGVSAFLPVPLGVGSENEFFVALAADEDAVMQFL